jgi:hypothetical protein
LCPFFSILTILKNTFSSFFITSHCALPIQTWMKPWSCGLMKTKSPSLGF